MFQNLHLASYVNQLQQQTLANGKLRSSIQSQGQTSGNGRNPKSVTSIGGLPRQQTAGEMSPKKLKDGSVNDYNPLQFMAVGSRLSMATYTKKESQNPGMTNYPGYSAQQQKVLKNRKQQQQVKQEFLQKMAPTSQKKQTSKSLAPFGNATAGKQSLNSDLFPLGKMKQSNASLTKTRVSKTVTQESRNSVNTEALNILRQSGGRTRAIRPASLYKPAVQVQTKDDDSQHESQVLQAQSIAEAAEEHGYLPMNINVQNGVIRGSVFNATQSQTSQEEILPSGSPSVSVTGDPDDLGAFDVFAGKQPQPKGNMKKVTVNAVGAQKKLHVSQFNLDQEQSDLNEESKGELNTASIATQNFNTKDMGEDYTTAVLPTGSKNSSMHQTSKQFKVQGGTVPGTSTNPQKHRRSMAMMKESDQTVTAAGLEFKYASLANTPPNLDGITSVGDHSRVRAQSTMMSGKTSQLIRVTSGLTKAEGGIVTTTILKVANRSPSEKRNVNIMKATEILENRQQRGVAPISARNDYHDPKKQSHIIKCAADAIVDAPINIRSNLNSQKNLAAAASKENVSRNAAQMKIDLQKHTSRGKITTNMSMANFSHLERQQNNALLGITGSTLSQYMRAQNLKGTPTAANNWRQKHQMVFSNLKESEAPPQNQNQNEPQQSRQPEKSAPNSFKGMKGGKLAKNSNFSRIQNFKKKVNNDADCLSINSNEDNKCILVNDHGQYMPLSNRMVLSLKDTHALKSPTSSGQNSKKQSITVQSRPKTQDDYRWKLQTAMQDTHSGQGSPHVPLPTNEPLTQDSNLQLGNMNLQSWGSSNEQIDALDHDDLKATMENIQEQDGTGTILIMAPNDADKVSRSTSFNNKRMQEPKLKDGNPSQTRSGVLQNELHEVNFEACVHRESGGVIMHDRIENRDAGNRDYATAQLSTNSNREIQSLLKIEVESKQNGSSGVLNLVQNLNPAMFADSDDPGTKTLMEDGENTKKQMTGVILNFPLPEDFDTLHMKKVNSNGTVTTDGIPASPHYTTGKPDTSKSQHRRPVFSPTMRTFQKKDGQYRNSRSQHSTRTRMMPTSDASMVVGTKFKPQIVFKESDLQHLFEKADHPVQQVIQKVLLDDIDLFEGYSYQSSVKKQKAKGEKSAHHLQHSHTAATNDHIKYEFIEKLLKKPDKEMTKQTLKEMTMLYQELLEKNLSHSSIAMTRANMQSIHDQGSIQVNSANSIIVLTDQKGNAIFETQGANTSQPQIQDYQGLTEPGEAGTRLEGSSLGRRTRGSLQEERLKLKYKKGSEGGQRPNPLVSVSPKKKQSLQSMDEVDPKQELVTVGKIIQNSSGSNTLFLELGQQKWSSQMDDYGGAVAGSVTHKGGVKSGQISPAQVEIDGKKRNILKNHDDKHDSNTMLTQMTFKENEVEEQHCGGAIKSAQYGYQKNNLVREETSLTVSNFSLKQKLNGTPTRNGVNSGKQSRSPSPRKQNVAKDCGAQTHTPATVLLSHTPTQYANSATPGDNSASVMSKAAETQTVNEMFKNRKFNATSLSPRIAAIEAKIGKSNAGTQVKTQEDVESLVRILGIGLTSGEPTPEEKETLEILKNIDLIQLQTARSAFLSFRANQMNTNKVIVGNETRNLNERKRFIEQLFYPCTGGNTQEYQSQILNLYEQKLVAGSSAIAQASNNKSCSTKRTENRSELVISGREAQLKEPKPRSSSKIEASRGTMMKRNTNKSHTSVPNRSGTCTPFNEKSKSITNVVSSNSKAEKSGYHHERSSNLQRQILAEQQTNLESYQKKEEKQAQSNEITEKKNVMKHELKVPKAGKLDMMKSSRIRKLSSNQVTGFRLRKVTSNMPTEGGDADEGKWLYQTQYGMGSNQDLVDLLKKPKNKSSINVFNQGSAEREREDEELLGVNSEDQEEVGTQMMISRKNLSFPAPPIQLSVASPKGLKADGVEKQGTQGSDAGNSALNLVDGEIVQIGKIEPEELAYQNNQTRNMPGLSKIKSVNSNDSNAVHKIGTIKVKELYQLRDNVNSQMASKQSTALSSSNKLQVNKQHSSVNTSQEKKVINLGLLRAQQQQKSKSQTANFERLSGLITESNTNKKKAKLLAHYRRIKEAERDNKKNQDWRKATPGISSGSTFYKDLFELRSNVRGGSKNELNLTQQLDQTMIEMQKRDVNDESRDLLRSSIMMFSQTQQRPQLSNMLHHPEIKRNQRPTFSISKNVLTPGSKKLVTQLLAQVSSSEKPQVQPLKQTCLVQFILEEWSSTIKGQLKSFEHSCTFSDTLQVGDGGETTEAYSVVIYGNQTPISNCCKQLICFQFAKKTRQVTVYCLEPDCRRSRLESRPLNPEIFHTVFMTAKSSSSKHKVIFTRNSPKKQRVLLVAGGPQPHHTEPLSGTRKHITLSSQSMRSPSQKLKMSNIDTRVLTPPEVNSTIATPVANDQMSGKYSRQNRQEEWMSGEQKLVQSNDVMNKVIQVSMQLTGKDKEEILDSSEKAKVIKYFQRQQTLKRPSKVSPTNESEQQFSLDI